MGGPHRPCKVCQGSGTYRWYESMGELGSIPYEDPCFFCRGKGVVAGRQARVYVPKAKRCVDCEHEPADLTSPRCAGCDAYREHTEPY